MATDSSLIDQFFDLQALINQQNEILQKNSEFAKKMKDNFSQALNKQDISGLQAISKEIDKVAQTTSKAKTQVTDFEKAQKNLEKQIAQNSAGQEKLNEVLNIEANSLNELQAKSKLLESVRKNLNITDANYEKNQKRIIASQDAINKKLKEYQTAENQRLSGIGKYKEAIEQALKGEGNYRQQLMKLRNTMSELDGAIEIATKKYGENSKEVKDLTNEYLKLEQQAGKVTDAQGDMQQRINYLADDYGKFKAVLSGVQAAMGIVSVFQGFTSLLGIHSKRVEEVTARMASLLAVMKGLKEVQELLNRDNYFVQFIKTTPILNRALTKTTVLFNRLKASMMAVGGYVAGFIVVIAALVKAVKHFSGTEFTEFVETLDKAADKTERLSLATDFLTKRYGELNISLGGIYESAMKVAKSFDEIIEKMVKMAVVEAGKSKLQEVIDATLKFAVYKQKAMADIDEIDLKYKQTEDAFNKYLADTKEAGQEPMAGTMFTFNKMFADLKNSRTAITRALDELYTTVSDKQTEYKEVMSINAEEVAKIMKDLTKDYAKELEKIAAESKETTKKTTKSITEVAESSVFSVKKLKIAVRDLSDSNMQGALKKFNKEFDDFNKVLKELNEENINKLNVNIEALRSRLYAGEITLEKYNEEMKLLSATNIKEGILTQIAYLEALSSTANAKDLEELTKKIKELRKELNDIKFEEFVSESELEKTVAKVQKIVNQIQEVADIVASSISEVFSQLINDEEEALKRADSNYMRSYDARKSYIENNIADETERAEALRSLEVERLDNQAITQQKEADLQERKARFDNAITIVKTQLILAGAIAAAIAEAVAGDPYTLPGRIAAAAAAAVAAGAAVYSAISQAGAVPSYAQGGLAEKGMPFRAGEEGEEIGFGQNSGKIYKFDKDAIYKVNENVKILTARESKQISSQTINNNKEVNLRNVVYVKVIDNQRIKKYFRNI